MKVYFTDSLAFTQQRQFYKSGNPPTVLSPQRSGFTLWEAPKVSTALSTFKLDGHLINHTARA
ncbi:hypothetical protein [Nostoc sp. NZL]|uniref:hypothetical protein n=1 Tax=Nostoc sp. NZL TaxID=2650612 RepID=UPI0018C75F07|nr:hypothetical protein [Nostoc sp. NZL]MBG1239866.1 hypothetical protein [Nostoc sp. NZL]